EDMLNQRAEQARAQGGELVRDGAVIVEKAKEYYAVTLPPLSLRGKNNTRVDIGMIAVNASPGKEEGEWRMSVALPMPLIVRDMNQDGRTLTVDIARQNMAGIWHEKIEGFSKLNAR